MILHCPSITPGPHALALRPDNADNSCDHPKASVTTRHSPALHSTKPILLFLDSSNYEMANPQCKVGGACSLPSLSKFWGCSKQVSFLLQGTGLPTREGHSPKGIILRANVKVMVMLQLSAPSCPEHRLAKRSWATPCPRAHALALPMAQAVSQALSLFSRSSLRLHSTEVKQLSMVVEGNMVVDGSRQHDLHVRVQGAGIREKSGLCGDPRGYPQGTRPEQDPYFNFDENRRETFTSSAILRKVKGTQSRGDSLSLTTLRREAHTLGGAEPSEQAGKASRCSWSWESPKSKVPELSSELMVQKAVQALP